MYLLQAHEIEPLKRDNQLVWSVARFGLNSVAICLTFRLG